MFNFTKKHHNTPGDGNDQAAEISEKYHAAMKRIEQLEDELIQSNKNQTLMIENVKHCIASLFTVQDQLHAVVMYLEHLNRHILELTQENKVFKSSGDEWLKRAIKLEFDVLAAKDALKKIENERDLAIKMNEFLQAKLISANRKK